MNRFGSSRRRRNGIRWHRCSLRVGPPGFLQEWEEFIWKWTWKRHGASGSNQIVPIAAHLLSDARVACVKNVTKWMEAVTDGAGRGMGIIDAGARRPLER